ncbi:sulfatase-like hydrolase/transferase [Sulfitobacter mediterraneus]|uniref:sulfatase-like hydrolase/transferase n=1 Tax=Sulfitobacter mediterraneus TaxID=83219 RepID=UPI0021A6C430|nr:sulfatase-like hydrolase/transferase [Sulfitobacter mediterraneus]
MSLQPKNVLFLMADEHQAAALSYLGHGVAKTPNLDRLAARGTLFENAYSPSPICVPARAAVATGKYVHQTGYWDNAHAYDGRVKGWGHVLQTAGVPVTSIGKLHYRSEQDSTGFDRQILPIHIAGGVGQVWGSVRNPLPKTRKATGMLGHIGAGTASHNAYDMKVAKKAATWIAEQDQATPWCAFVSFVAPHFPLTVPEEFLNLYPSGDMPLPAVRPGQDYDLHPWVARMNDIENSDEELETDSNRQEAIAAYYALCSFVDAQIGKVLDALDASGQADETLVIYTSDHGENLGLRGRWGKSVLYRESTHIPMILAGPGVADGARVKTAVSLLDIAPTITAAFGLPDDPGWPGHSLSAIAAQPEDADRIVFSEYHAANSPSGGFMVANARWKYHEYVGYAPELFDLAQDPLETRNLVDEPDAAADRDRMRAALHAICNPEAVDGHAKADQDALVARHGGPEKAFNTGPSGATPVPGS